MLLILEQIKTALNAVLTTANINIEKLKLYVDDKLTKNNKETDSKINAMLNNIVGKKTDSNGEVFNDYENNVATGDYSHASGYETKATGYASHAEGYGSKADGFSSHVEGYSTRAYGDYAHAEGNDTFAPGDYSHVEGQGTKASSIHQHVQGKYNIEDKSSKYAHIVGNGSYSHRSNAHTLDWDGNAWYSGTLKLGGTSYDAASEVALKKDIPTVPTKTSDLINDSGFLNKKPTYTAAEVGADSKGTASSTVSTHNTALDAHNDIRLLISNLTTIINTILNSEDVDLDQLSEIVAYIKSNRSLIEQVTTNKINVSDIIDNLTTNVANKPLSAKQGVALKALIDAIKVPTKLSELSNDKGYITKAPVEVAVQSGTPSEGALWVDTDGEGEIILAEIDDTTYSGEKTWSSNKIKSEMAGLNENIVQQILVMTESELEALSQEELAEKYTKGTKIIITKEDYENLVPKAIGKSGAIYNGYGYMSGYRFNLSGDIIEAEQAVVTGFIPYTYGNEIRIVGGLSANTDGGQYIATYNESFELIKVHYLHEAVSGSGGTSTFKDKNVREDIIKTSKFSGQILSNSFKNAKYIRISLNPCVGKDMSVSCY